VILISSSRSVSYVPPVAFLIPTTRPGVTAPRAPPAVEMAVLSAPQLAVHRAALDHDGAGPISMSCPAP